MAPSHEATYPLTKDNPIHLLKTEVRSAKVLTRLNRFLVEAEDNGEKVFLHLTNTGRLHDLIYPGATILYTPRPSAKTAGVLAGVIVGSLAAVVDTRLQARCFEEAFNRRLIPWLQKFSGYRKEVFFMGSRIDYLLSSNGEKAYLELKSAAYLGRDGAAMYPDTVSTRGRTHVQKLAEIAATCQTYLVFVAALPDARFFTPCDEGDPDMRPLLIKARRAGVEIRCIKLYMTLDGDVYLDDPDLPVRL